jgi:hypothetical protein
VRQDAMRHHQILAPQVPGGSKLEALQDEDVPVSPDIGRRLREGLRQRACMTTCY